MSYIKKTIDGVEQEYWIKDNLDATGANWRIAFSQRGPGKSYQIKTENRSKFQYTHNWKKDGSSSPEKDAVFKVEKVDNDGDYYGYLYLTDGKTPVCENNATIVVSSEAEYFEQKAAIEATIAKLDKQIKSLSGNDIGADEAYLAQLSKLIMIKKLQDTNSDFDYYKLAKAIGRKPIHDFLAEIISRIIMGEQNKIMKIIFKNGVSITFQYEK